MATTIQAIDVHGHYGVSTDQKCARTNRFMTGDAAAVVRRARRAGVAITVVSPLPGLLIRSHEQVEAANRDAARVVARHAELRQWAILDPLNERTFGQVSDLLTTPRCVGIKIHPEQHRYPIRRYGRRLFAFAEKHGAVVLTHSGQERSLPSDFVRLANDFPGVRLILAHLGFGHDQDVSHQVRAIRRSRHGNLFVDTSSAMSICPNLIEWAVREIGVERILFGTDTPLYFAPMQRARIEQAEISESARRRILVTNASRLLDL